MNIIKFILFIGFVSQICAQLNINYFRINNIVYDESMSSKVLEADAFSLNQQQWDWNYGRWQQWIIYWVDQPNGLAMVFDRHNYRALTATSATTFETQYISSSTHPEKARQIWKIRFGSIRGDKFWDSTIESTYYPGYIISPEISDMTNGLHWGMDYCPGCGYLTLQYIAPMAEDFNVAFNYKILGYYNPTRSLDLYPNWPQVWTNGDTNNNQKITFTAGTCNGQPAYKISNALGRYIVSDGANAIVTYSCAPPDQAWSSWWHLRPQYDFYNLAYKIESCRESGKYLTFPNVDNDGNPFYLSSSPPGWQGHFYLRKM
jgi:hypothetical protein